MFVFNRNLITKKDAGQTLGISLLCNYLLYFSRLM